MLEKDLKSLINILEESNINELEVTTFWGKQKIRLRKKTSNIINYDDSQGSATNQLINDETIISPQPLIDHDDSQDLEKSENISTIHPQESQANIEEFITIKAPLVGTFYKSAKPDMPPYITEGGTIKEGQIICIIEAMKIFNEIESEHSGKIIKILIDDATPVEFDQDLIIISPE